ncbi:MAG: hypothetical protein AAF614_24595 [Chloroflexota bacterium]
MISNVHFEQTPERLKIVLPVKRRWFLMALYTLLVLIWLVMLAWGIIFTIQDAALSGERYAFVFTTMLLILLYILYRLGRRAVWGPWQGLMANREILFINKDQFIIRRPLSLLGTTDFYALEHIGHFFFLDEHDCPAFSYGQFRTEFGHGLDRAAADSLINFLNDRYIPERDDDDEEDDEYDDE